MFFDHTLFVPSFELPNDPREPGRGEPWAALAGHKKGA